MKSSEYVTLRIKQRLQQMKLSQKEFGDLVDAQYSTVTKWLSGEHNFTMNTLDKIQAALNIDLFNTNNQQPLGTPCSPCYLEEATKFDPVKYE